MPTQRRRGLRVWSAIISSIWNARPIDHDSDLFVRASDVGFVISEFGLLSYWFSIPLKT